jgi:hypothetical protein
MPFQSGIGSGGGGGGSGTVTSVSLRDENSVSTSAITTSGFFQLDAGPGISTAASGYTVTISGGPSAIATKSANYTVTTADDFIVSDLATAGADITMTLPSAASSTGERWTFIDDGGAGTHKTIISSADQINGATTYNLIGPRASVSVVSTGTTFLVF